MTFYTFSKYRSSIDWHQNQTMNLSLILLISVMLAHHVLPLPMDNAIANGQGNFKILESILYVLFFSLIKLLLQQCSNGQILRLYRILFLGIFNNTLNREDREKRKISAPPTMETPDRRTSFIKNVSASHSLKGNLHDNPSYTIPGQNDNEFHSGFPSVITEQIEPSIGKCKANKNSKKNA